MLHLRRLTLREIRLPLREAFEISSGVVTERRILLLELRDASGGRSAAVRTEAPVPIARGYEDAVAEYYRRLSREED